MNECSKHFLANSFVMLHSMYTHLWYFALYEVLNSSAVSRFLKFEKSFFVRISDAILPLVTHDDEIFKLLLRRNKKYCP